ncbi:hypothetical protein CRG98_049662 [Punica granatum]|uniref:Uncharacterized protein n=1 Tax=Punica granatum TaxID=22663 RepID=A0A2I0H5T1_PUNGR|nr:hypothetical protein CRG98_049662 [Punica granatum]
MASDHEPAKILLPYLQRADELQEHEPLVAYNCKAVKTLHPRIPCIHSEVDCMRWIVVRRSLQGSVRRPPTPS